MVTTRSYVGFDILRRIMEDYFRLDVNYVMNITDIDDKIIKKANRIALVKTVENVSKLQNDKLKQLVSEYEEKLRIDAEAKDKKLQLTMRQIYEMRKNIVKTAEDLGIKNIEVEPDFIGVPRFYEKMFWRDLKSLNCRPPSIIVRVTEFVPEIVQFIQKIVDNGFAYESEGSVYFDVDAFRNAYCKDGKIVTGNCENEENLFKFVYGKLEPWSVEDSEKLKEGEGESQVDTEKTITKRSARDFALWKRSVPGEPSWDSPWGKGRPGWHIECSAMAAYAFQNASSIDIHCGGVDLRFPHHDNELAQSEAHFCCKQWVNYFLHTGHLSIEGLTMSKSKKNFLTIAGQLEHVYNARQVRLLFLMHKFNDAMDYSASTMKTAIDVERMFVEFFANIKIVLREESYAQYEKWDKPEFELSNLLSEKKKQIHDALCDSFNTPLVMKHLIDLKDATNTYLQFFSTSEKKKTPNLSLLRSIAAYVTDMFRIFGLIDTDSIGFSLKSDTGSETNFEENITPLLDAFAQFRDDIRTISRDALNNKELTKDALAQLVLQKCDQVRDDVLPQLGVRLEDRPDIGKTVWKLEDVKTLMLERQRKIDEEQRNVQTKFKQLEENLRKAREAYEKTLQDPAHMFKNLDLYSEWDENGIPTKLKDGTELTKSNRKKLEKEHSKQVAIFNDEKKRAILEKDLRDKEVALQKFKLQNRLN
jgi:cysteinyl-tRNA synthetase